MKKSLAAIGILVLTVVFLVVLYTQFGSQKISEVSISSSASSGSSSMKRKLSTQETKDEVYKSLQAISLSLQQQDSKKFDLYVDKISVCESLITPLMQAFEALVGGEAKSKAITQCVDDLSAYASGKKDLSGASTSTGRSFYSLEELFRSPGDIEVITDKENIIAVIKKPEGNLGFGFVDTGEILRLVSVHIGYTLKNE